MVEIRTASGNDAEEIVNLSDQLGYGTDVNDVTERILRIENDLNSCIYVAVIDKAVVGWIQGLYTIRLESMAFVEITGLVVNMNYRKMNIGRKLIDEVLKWARPFQVEKVKVRCNTIRTESHKFYEKTGFKLIKEQKVFEIYV